MIISAYRRRLYMLLAILMLPGLLLVSCDFPPGSGSTTSTPTQAASVTPTEAATATIESSPSPTEPVTPTPTEIIPTVTPTDGLPTPEARSGQTLIDLSDAGITIQGYEIPLVPVPADKADNCSLSISELYGQRIMVSGTTSGLILMPPDQIPVDDGGLLGIGTALSDASLEGVKLLRAANPLQDPSVHTVILIVDDFGIGDANPINMDNVQDIAENGDPDDVAEAKLKDLDLPHGFLVEQHFKSMKTGIGASNPPAADKIKLVRVNTRDASGARYNTKEISRGIQTQIAKEFSNDPEIRHFVVNMSFAVVPCVVADDFVMAKAAGNGLTFYEYIQEIYDQNPQLADALGELNTSLMSIMLNPLPGDPLLDFSNTLCVDKEGVPRQQADPFITNGEYGPYSGNLASSQTFVDDLMNRLRDPGVCQVATVIFVASSGNLGWSFPLVPAGWPNVVSVGARTTIDGNGWKFSNYAFAWEEGVWYGIPYKRPAYYAGTSFAAPVMSMRLALGLINP